jgi:hypothetical protein
MILSETRFLEGRHRQTPNAPSSAMEGVFLIKGAVDLLSSKNGRVAAELGW